MPRLTRHKVTTFVMLTFVCTSLSSCSKFQEWGEAFPVSENAKRCDDWFCFSDEPQRASASNRQTIPINGGQAAQAPQTPPNFGQAPDPRFMQPSPQNGAIPQAPNAFGKEMAAQAISDQSGYPAGVRPPYSDVPVGGFKASPAYNSGQIRKPKQLEAYDLPEGYGQRMPEQQAIPPKFKEQMPINQNAPVIRGDQQLRPHEEFPEWKNDLPPSKFESLQRSLDW